MGHLKWLWVLIKRHSKTNTTEAQTGGGRGGGRGAWGGGSADSNFQVAAVRKTAKSEGAGLHPVNCAKSLCRAKLCSGEVVLRGEFKVHRIETPRQRKEKILIRERKRIAGGLSHKI